MERHPTGTKARLAVALFLYTGVRISDAVRLGPQLERDGALYFTEEKNRATKPKHREIPILPLLRAELDASPPGHLAYLVTKWNRPHARGMSRLLLKFVQQALLVEQATQPWPSVQGRG